MAQVSLRRLPDVPEIFRKSGALGNLAEKKIISQKITSCNRHYLFSALQFDIAQCATPLGDRLLFCGSLHALGFPQDAFFFRHFFFRFTGYDSATAVRIKTRRSAKTETADGRADAMGTGLLAPSRPLCKCRKTSRRFPHVSSLV